MKKKTRRGSRGGRNRKKKPAGTTAAEGVAPEDGVGAAAEDTETEFETETEPPSPLAPRIHVPDFELGGEEKPSRKRAAPKPKTEPVAEGDDEAPEQAGEAVTAESAEDGDGDAPPVKKKTRRGSRGGRNRKKPAATAGALVASENGAEPAPVAVESEASGNGAEPAADEYVPMSEWLDDLDA